MRDETELDRPTRVLVVDGQPLIRDALDAVVWSQSDLAWAGGAASPAEAVQLLPAADVVVTDVVFGTRLRLGFLRRFRAVRPQVAIVVHSGATDGEDAIAGLCRALTADAVLPKGCELADLLRAVRRAAIFRHRGAVGPDARDGNAW